jgi:antitoxin PrlF
MPVKKISPETECCDRRECCRVEAVISIDGRGQLVLPKEVRDRMGLAAGDKIALVTINRDGKPCCIVLTKADNLAKNARELLGPLVEEL